MQQVLSYKCWCFVNHVFALLHLISYPFYWCCKWHINAVLSVLFLFDAVFCAFTALAEIVSVKEVKGTKSYYVHYVDCKYYSCAFF